MVRQNPRHVIKGTAWLAELEPSIDAYRDPPKTLEDLWQAVSNPKQGHDIHHIVEKAAAERARPDRTPRGEHASRQRPPGLDLTLHEVHGGGRRFVVDRLHAFLGQRTSVFMRWSSRFVIAAISLSAATAQICALQIRRDMTSPLENEAMPKPPSSRRNVDATDARLRAWP